MDQRLDKVEKAVGDLTAKVTEISGRVSSLPGLWQILGPVFGIVALSTTVLAGALWASVTRLDNRIDRVEARLDTIYTRLDDRLRGIEQRQAAADATLQTIAQAVAARPQAPQPNQ